MPARIPMTTPQREAFLALPDTEEAVLRFHHLDADDLVAIATARTPGTRLGYALQLCCLRYPGRHLRRGEVLPAILLDHVADQIGAETDVIAGFARRMSTRYDQLAGIKMRFGFEDLSHPMRERLRPWVEREAIGLTDGRMLLDRFLDKLRRVASSFPASASSSAWRPKRCSQPRPGSLARSMRSSTRASDAHSMLCSPSRRMFTRAASPGCASPTRAWARSP